MGQKQKRPRGLASVVTQGRGKVAREKRGVRGNQALLKSKTPGREKKTCRQERVEDKKQAWNGGGSSQISVLA